MFSSILCTATRVIGRSICVKRIGLAGSQFVKVQQQVGVRLLSRTCGTGGGGTSLSEKSKRSLLQRARCGRCIRTCSCGLSTAVDKDLADFLTDEIKLEKMNEKTPGTLPTVKQFEVSSTDGANVTLTKKSDNELVTVTLNVNNTVNDEAMDFEEPSSAAEKTEPHEPQMLSQPPFMVEITNKSGQSLAIQCSFPTGQDDMPMEDGQENYVDTIEIQEVAFLKTSGDWSESDFTVQGSIMDGTLYDMLLNLLESRGIDAAFVEQLVEFSTAYEHRNYINFLTQLQQFSSK